MSFVVDCRLGALARAVTVMEPLAVPGDHVAEWRPVSGLVSRNCSGGSPFEKVATTCPLTTGSPQSSASWMTSGVGHPAGAAKLLTTPVCVSASFAGVQPATALSFTDEGPAVDGCTTKVTLVVRTSELENEYVTSPV